MLEMWNCFSTWSIIVTAILLYLYHWYKRPKHFPPGPRGVPLLGVIPFLGKFPERVMKRWGKKYGSIMSVRFGPNDVVVLNDFEAIQQAFVKQSTAFSGRPQMEVMHQITSGYGIALTDYGEFWKTQRRFGLNALRGSGASKQNLEGTILEEVSCFCDAIREENGKTFSIKDLLHNAVSNIICNVGFGKRFDYDDSKFKEVLDLLVTSTDDPFSNAYFLFASMAPFIMKIPPFSTYNKKMLGDVEIAMNMLQGFVRDHEETFDEMNIRNFIDAFLLEMKKKTDDSFCYKQLYQYIRDLFEAGSGTTANTLIWALLCLIHYPEVQTKLRKEINNVIGSEGQVSFQKRLEMPCVCAFMEEVFRFRTLAPLGVQHSTTENVRLGNFVIPKGTMVMPNIWAVHNDETFWNKPEKFDPDRFLDEKGNFARSPHVMSFSVGPRHCLGEQLARMEFFIFLVSLVRRFEILPDPEADKLPEIDDGSNGFLFVANSFKLMANEL